MTKRKRLAFTIGLAAAALGFFALCALTPYYGDDYSYMFTYAADTPKIRITNLQELYLSQLNHYQIMNGRAIVHTLVQLLLMPDGRELFCLLDTLVFLALGFAVYYAAYGTLRRFKPLSLFAAWALIFLSLPAFGQSCLWLTGAVNYMWTTFAALCFLLPYRSDGSGGDRAALRTIGMPFLGVLAGWSGENACIAAALGLVLLLVRRRLLRLPFRAWMWTGVIGFSAGAAALFLSPAQALKAGNMGGIGGVLTWISRIPSVSFHALEYLWLPLVLGIALLILSIRRSRGHGFRNWLRRYSAALIWFACAVVGAYCMCAAPYFPERAWCASGVFAAAAVLAAYAALDKPVMSRRALGALTAAGVIACAALYASGAVDLLFTRAAVIEREESILEQKAAGAETVYVSAVSGQSRCNCFDPAGDLVSDPEAWQNRALARYYEVERIIAE